jgi:cardiolipin synthase
MTIPWKHGNSIRLLENGEEFFPAVLEAVASAQQEVLIETFILAEDPVGIELKDALVAAARRGATVTVTVDDYGSPSFSEGFLSDLKEAGITLLVFDPQPRAFGMRTNLFRRLHRKLVVVDQKIGFIGGLNYSVDHLLKSGPLAKQDYAVELRGPIVADLHEALRNTLKPAARRFRRRPVMQPVQAPVIDKAGDTTVALVVRDNDRHRDDIERHYRMAIRLAQREIIIANAYFLPGYRMLRDLAKAARRGVHVQLILQGQPDMPWVRATTMFLYDYLLKEGVEIHEYCQRPLHGKVALIDDEWATVGSSNLDPLSLSLNLEANVIVRDRAFTRLLRSRLVNLMNNHCKLARPTRAPALRFWRLVAGSLLFHFLRRFPAWSGWLPAHRPALKPAAPAPVPVEHVQEGNHEAV